MIRKGSFYILIMLLLWYLFSCEIPPPCDDADGVQANLGFYNFSGNVLNDTLIDSLVVYALNDDMTRYFDGTMSKIKTIALPLSLVSDTSVFIFHFGNDGVDTLEFRYTQYTKLISHECGFVNYYDLTEIITTHNLIDSVWVRKELVEYGNEENVKIYF